MRNRLSIFAAALLLLPPLALSLSGQEWQSPGIIGGSIWLPAFFGTIMVLAVGILLDTLTYRRTHHSLLRSQRAYLLWNGVAGAVACTLLAYLNLFADAWLTPAASGTEALLLAALGGTALLPAVLIMRQ